MSHFNPNHLSWTITKLFLCLNWIRKCFYVSFWRTWINNVFCCLLLLLLFKYCCFSSLKKFPWVSFCSFIILSNFQTHGPNTSHFFGRKGQQYPHQTLNFTINPTRMVHVCLFVHKWSNMQNICMLKTKPKLVVSFSNCFVCPNEGCRSVLQLFCRIWKTRKRQISSEVTLTLNAAICQVLSDTMKVSTSSSTKCRTSRHQRYFQLQCKRPCLISKERLISVMEMIPDNKEAINCINNICKLRNWLWLLAKGAKQIVNKCRLAVDIQTPKSH